MAAKKVSEFRNRIVGLKYVKPSDLIPSKKNWREHGIRQKEIMKSMFKSVGIAGAMLARPAKGKPGKYELFDGAMRTDLLSKQTGIPVLVTDLTDKELDVMLATYDKIGEYAGRDNDAYSRLMESLSAGYADLVRQFDVSELVAKKPEKKALKPYKKLHILISCDVDKIDTVQQILDNLLGMKGVQIEKSAN